MRAFVAGIATLALLVEAHHDIVRVELSRHRGTEWDTAGDGFYATFDGSGRAVRCAFAIRDAIRRLGLEVRAGAHTRECELIAGKLGGMSTVIGARVKVQAGAGEVFATSTVRDLVSGSWLVFERSRSPFSSRVFPVTGRSSPRGRGRLGAISAVP